MKKIIFICLLALLFLLGRGFYFLTYSSGLADNKLIFEIKPGMGVSQIARGLKNQNLILTTTEFKVFVKIMGASQSLRIGEYELNRGLMPGQILNIFKSGKSIARSITFPEGFNIYEMAELLDSKGFVKKNIFLNLCYDSKYIKELLGKQQKSLEGYLFPDTYKFTKFEKPKKIISTMVQRFLKTYKKIRNENRFQVDLAILPNRHSIVTLASIIEKETGAAEERPIISSVFHNRLNKKMRLQTDPTVIYGILDKTGVMTKNIRKKDLREPNKYNTYTFRGLPVGPIANPGKEALLAALQPEPTDFLYFVSRNQGTHVFSKNYRDHTNAVRRFQLNRAARKGKSWRDLKKKK